MSWLHFVETRPLVGQPEFVFMQLQSSDASFMEHAAGTFLQELGVHAIMPESKLSEQYSPEAHVAVPHEAPVEPLVPPLVPPLVLAAPGQSEAKLMAPAIESQLLPSRHVSCSADGLALQTCEAQLDFALGASAPGHFKNFASQRLAQSGAEAAVPPEVPELPDVAGVEAVVEEQARVSTVPSAIDLRMNVERGA